MTLPACPSCGTVLAKQPTRKIRCKDCGELIFVKNTPDDHTKRPMTSAQAEAAQQQWAKLDAECRFLEAAEEFDIPGSEMAHAIRTYGDHTAALRALLEPRAMGGDERAIGKLMSLSETLEDLRGWVFQDLMVKLEQLTRMGYRKDQMTLEVKQPEPWGAGAEIGRRHDAGEPPEAIAKALQCSLTTVKLQIVRRGLPEVCGPHCAERVGTYPIDEGLAKLAIPCSLGCACRHTICVATDKPPPNLPNSVPTSGAPDMGIVSSSSAFDEPPREPSRRMTLREIFLSWLGGARE